MAKSIKDIDEIHEYHATNWRPIRDDARIDMRYVAGNPWDADDRKLRGKRPTIAPEEMSQYRNQVINSLMMNPRGMKFSPVGCGASKQGADFYQSKARETEYRSHATHAYSVAAENALMRSYGYVRVNVRRASASSTNLDIWIDSVPNPNMVLPDTDFVKPDLSDMRVCFVEQWISHERMKADYGSRIRNFKALAADKRKSQWFTATRAKVAEFWEVRTEKRTILVLSAQNGQTQQVFADAFDPQSMHGFTVSREQEIDYPRVYQRLINGQEFLGDETKWYGKYIPIVGCFGKVLYLDEEGEGTPGGVDGIQQNRQILSMTRFGRDPWKAYCYASSQELEVLGMVPRAPMVMYRGQATPTQYQNLVRSMSQPVAALEFEAYTDDYRNDDQAPKPPLPLPQPMSYVQVQHLQALEVVREGFRRAIQSAMASNFLPTDAQKISSDDSGLALNSMQKSAERGTYHFVQGYEDMIRQVGVIFEDLVPHIHDYAGETGVIDPAGNASMQGINGYGEKPIDTAGDYLVTVSAGQNSDSDRAAATEFTDNLVGNIQAIAPIIGPQKTSSIIAISIRNRGLGPMGDAIADVIDPQPAEGEEQSPALRALQGENQQLKGALQQAAQEKEAKTVELQGKLQIEREKMAGQQAMNAQNNEVKLAVAELNAKVDKLALFLEESHLVGARQHEQSTLGREHAHAVIEGAKERAHTSVENALTRQHASDLSAQTAAQTAEQQATQQSQESGQ